MEELKKRLKQLKDDDLYRDLKYLQSPQEKEIFIDEKKYLLMSSNNYLGFANRKEIKNVMKSAIEHYGVGSGGSRITTGSYVVHRELETKLAKFFDKEDSIVFNTGFAANNAVISSICNENYVIFSDELNHASIIDGCKLSKAKTVVFKHNNIEDLENKLKDYSDYYKFIITEGVFSMSGDIAPLDKIVEVAKRYEASIMVDDAHGIGVLGENGKGVLNYFNLNSEIDIYLGTLSKAIGTEGGFVCAKSYIIDFLRNKARGFIYSTAIAPSICAASIKSIELLEIENNTAKLVENIKYFELKFKKIFKNLKCNSAIIKIPIGNESKALKISKFLFDNNVLIPAIRYPTVKKNEAILRVCLMSTHIKNDIDRVYNLFIKIFEK